MFFEVGFEFQQISFKSLVGLYYFSFILGVNAGVVIVHAVLLHEKGDDKGRAPGHSHLAMDDDIMVLKHGLDISMGLIKVRIYALILVVLQVNPFAVLYGSLLNLFLDAVVVVGPLIDDTQHTVDLQVGDQIRLVKHIHST